MGTQGVLETQPPSPRAVAGFYFLFLGVSPVAVFYFFFGFFFSCLGVTFWFPFCVPALCATLLILLSL